jgi:hypothetical protein
MANGGCADKAVIAGLEFNDCYKPHSGHSPYHATAAVRPVIPDFRCGAKLPLMDLRLKMQ